MKKLFFVLMALILLQGCGGQTTSYSYLSSGISIASGGKVAENILAAGSNLYIEKKTGKNTLQYVADKTIDSEIRECEIIHSAEINQIFFKTLDETDCKIN
tara:strand:- start:226 stop:528 length:303 start_codon:yes stop_codon:yes gene_type:complete